ncbi:MAG: FMN-binding glutamate synthase family protein [Comamonas sp.]|jgi:glutamate synthase domain-containing protein 2|uniref:FMN-binding glutamate synthase family protein n=1 Tax=Comamonas sp. TaxID=34028 RepID=UPI0028DB8877|nr:FMN-binding glutamate synthase family protein [uncultured Comamonas sp.]
MLHGPYRSLGLFPVRYTVLALCMASSVLGLIAALAWGYWWWLVPVIAALLTVIGVLDLRQTQHAILRNYPVIGHMRFLLEFIRPEMRQYFIEGDHEALPFSRAQRSLVYQRSKGEPDSRPFGTLLDVSMPGYEWVNHSMAPTKLDSQDFRVWIGGTPEQPLNGKDVCTRPYHASVFNISAMSFGALSANAVLALNLGARTGGFAHDTGEGSISQHHRVHGGDLIWQVASGYFGCRNPDGTFSEERFAANAADPQVKMIELKLSQGAKPGHGGMLLGAKVTPEIAAARGIAVGVDCISPSSHSAFHTPIEMLQFITKLRQLSGGKPVGIKLCVGHPWEWFAIVKAMMETDITPDFIVVDGAEGGTGAAPVEFTDHVGVPLQEGLLLVHNTLVGVNLRHRVQIGAAAKVITAFDIARMMALGANWCNAGRGFMMALGCIQAQTCHTGHCPTGVTTQDALRQKALVVPDKGTRVANFHRSTMHALKELVQAAGLHHPGDITAHHIVRRTNDSQVHQLANTILRVEPGALLGPLDEQHNVFKMYWGRATAQTFQISPPPLKPSATQPMNKAQSLN